METETPSHRTMQWCPECRRRRLVVETFTDSTYTPAGEQEYGVTVLDCEHQVHGPGHVVGPAPGAPWAPGALPNVAATRTREHTTADPWASDLPA